MASGGKGERDRAGGGGAAAAALHRPSGVLGHGGQQSGEGDVFCSSLSEPYVVLGHGTAVPLREGGGGAGDELVGLGQLPSETSMMVAGWSWIVSRSTRRRGQLLRRWDRSWEWGAETPAIGVAKGLQRR